MLLKNMQCFVELGDSVAKLNDSFKNIEARKLNARNVKEQKKVMMQENQGLVQEIQILMSNEDKATQRYDELTKNFQALEKADIQIRTEMKHNLNKKNKAKEAIEEIEKKKQKMISDNIQNQEALPNKEEELQHLIRQRTEIEQKFEVLEVQVRDATEKLRKEKDGFEAELNPMLN